MYLLPRSAASSSGDSALIWQTDVQSSDIAAPYTTPPSLNTCFARSEKTPPEELCSRSFSSRLYAAYAFVSGASSSVLFNMGHTRRHILQSTHFSSSTSGYKNPSASSTIVMHCFGQACVQAAHPQQFCLFPISIISSSTPSSYQFLNRLDYKCLFLIIHPQKPHAQAIYHAIQNYHRKIKNVIVKCYGAHNPASKQRRNDHSFGK